MIASEQASETSLTLTAAAVQIGEHWILREIDLSIKSGECVVVVGPNGAGKTTLLKSLSGEQQLSAGTVTLNKLALRAWPERQRAQQVAYLPQTSQLFFPFPCWQVVDMGRYPHSTKSEVNRALAQQTMETLDCAQFSQRSYTSLSAGEQQRVQLARVLCQVCEEEPYPQRYLLLDEATSMLDLYHQHLVLTEVKKLTRRGVGICMSLHDLNLALRYADKIVLLNHGKIVAAGDANTTLTEEQIQQCYGVDATLHRLNSGATSLIHTELPSRSRHLSPHVE